MSCHAAPTPAAPTTGRFALVGSPNAGKTTLFNALTGLTAKTGNYPGVTVARYEGTHSTPTHDVTIEDLPGTYSLEPISPDEQVVTQVLAEADQLDGVLVVLDATHLARGLAFLAQVQQLALPTAVVLTFTDDLARRGGSLDVEALSRAVNCPVIPVAAGERRGLAALSQKLDEVSSWARPMVPPPTDASDVQAWAASVLEAAHHRRPGHDERTRRIDAVLLHPVWGTLIFFVTMFTFFQVIFTVAAPLQGWVEEIFAWLGDLARSAINTPWLASLVADGLLGGVGGVLVFLPQIALLFLLISLLEGSGYLSRAAFLMDRVMSFAGLEGRAFVALLSSLACAIPGIMATRTLPSARDRIATMMGAPLMTCSARLPVYILLIGMLVPSDLRWGPIGAQGAILFGLYVLGAVSAMFSAWFFGRVVSRSAAPMPFYMEMPTYRIPRARTVLVAVWDACKAFLKKVTSVILVATLALWVLLNLPLHSTEEMAAAGVDVGDEVAVQAYVIHNSWAADVGRSVSPVFDPLGFDWRINVGVLSSLAAREVFVATLGQVASAENPEEPLEQLRTLTHDRGPRAGEPVLDVPTIVALMVFFVYALQCVSTLGVMRRETGTWRWPVAAFVMMGTVAWVMAFAARLLTGVLT